MIHPRNISNHITEEALDGKNANSNKIDQSIVDVFDMPFTLSFKNVKEVQLSSQEKCFSCATYKEAFPWSQH